MELYLGQPAVHGHSPLKERDFDELRSSGKSALSRGNFAEAIPYLFAALQGHLQAREEHYVKVAGMLRDALLGVDRPAEAASLDWFTGDRAGQQELLERLPPPDRARTLLSWASLPGPDAGRNARAAADLFESSGQLVRAAFAFERASDWERARALWSRLAPQLAASGKPYEAALAQFNLFRASRLTDERASRAAGIAAVHLLEEAADRYESAGQRERSFDCFLTLVAIGQEMGVYEHVLEGHVNASRILCEDHLRNYALEIFQEAIDSARAHGELVAAATLAREMASFARKEKEPTIGNHAALLEADLWRQAAAQNLQRGGPVSVSEHALLASVLALSEVGQYRTVGEVYAQLTSLKLDAPKLAHYERATRRYKAAQNEGIETDHVPNKVRDNPTKVWIDDLLEWEQAGDPAELCADILLGPEHNEFFRRQALTARLVALEARRRPDDVLAQTTLCGFLASLQCYPMVAAFERLVTHPSPQVREKAITELRYFRFKRTFQTIRQCLADPDVSVQHGATRTLELMRFPHAIEPLARIYREASFAPARQAAIQALAEIERGEAAELLLGILSFGTPEDRGAAQKALSSTRKNAFIDVARRAKADLDPTTQQLVKKIFQSRQLTF